MTTRLTILYYPGFKLVMRDTGAIMCRRDRHNLPQNGPGTRSVHMIIPSASWPVSTSGWILTSALETNTCKRLTKSWTKPDENGIHRANNHDLALLYASRSILYIISFCLCVYSVAERGAQSESELLWTKIRTSMLVKYINLLV